MSIAVESRATRGMVQLALEKIRRGHPSLGHHLTTCVHTGRFCCYAPDPANPVRWDI